MIGVILKSGLKRKRGAEMALVKGNKARVGIYMGLQGLTMVEQAAKKISNFVYIPYVTSEGKSIDIAEILSNSL